MKVLLPLLLVFSAIACVLSAEVEVARNLSFTKNDEAQYLSIQASRITFDPDTREGELDAVTLTLQRANIFYAHFVEQANLDGGGNLQNISAAAFAFDISFITLIEYIESNGVPGFQAPGINVPDDYLPGPDTFIGAYGDNRTQFSIDVNTVSVTQNDQTFDVLEITFSTLDEVFNYTVTAAGRTYTTPSGITLDENAFKIGFNVNFENLPSFGAHPTSQITLVLVAASTEGSSQNFNASEPLTTSLNLHGAGGYVGYIDFENFATAITPEEASSSTNITFDYLANNNVFNTSGLPQGWSGSVIFLNFAAIHPAVVSYDPEIGAIIPNGPSTSSSSSSSSSTSTTSAPASSASSLFVGAYLIMGLLFSAIFLA